MTSVKWHLEPKGGWDRGCYTAGMGPQTRSWDHGKNDLHEAAGAFRHECDLT